MNGLNQQGIHCPYCGEYIEVLLDPSEAGMEYIEDCQVCCRPIEFSLIDGGDSLTVEVKSELE